jgi:hypothetical protein
MSYVTIFTVHLDGTLSEHGTAKNGLAFAPLIWGELAKKYRIESEFFDMEKQVDGLVEASEEGRLSPEDKMVFECTLDRAFIPKENLKRASNALDKFFDEHCQDKARTIKVVAAVLENLGNSDGHFAGVCFQATSVSENPWVKETVWLDDDDEEYREVMFDPRTEASVRVGG